MEKKIIFKMVLLFCVFCISDIQETVGSVSFENNVATSLYKEEEVWEVKDINDRLLRIG